MKTTLFFQHQRLLRTSPEGWVLGKIVVQTYLDRWMNDEKMQEENLPSTLLLRIQKQPRKIIVLSCVDWWILEHRRKKICHQSPPSPAKNSKKPRKGSSIKCEDNAFLSILEATEVELLAKIVEPPSSKEVPDVSIVKYPEGLPWHDLYGKPEFRNRI